MAIFIPKSDIDGSALGLANKRWTKLHVSSSYVSSSYVNGSEVSSGSQGLMVDGHPIMLSPFHIDNFPSIGSNQVGIRLNNLLPADGNYSLDNNKITNAAYPSNDSDVANKLYVDNSIQGIKWKNSVKASSEPVGTSYFVQYEQATYTSDGLGGFNLTDTGTPGWEYASGSAGDGATLTFNIPKTSRTGNNPASNINDGTWTWKSSTGGATTTVSHASNLFDDIDNLIVGDRILIKDFADPYKGRNGIYEVFATGSGTNARSPSNPILKRVLDFNTGSEVPSAAVSVEEGSQNGDIAFVCTTDTDSIAGKVLGDFNIEFTVFGTATSDGITIYKDASQSNRFEVTGVLRDINDLFYDYSGGSRNSVGDGVFLVGNGSTFIAESGNTAKTSLGLGTSDNPTFNSITLTDALTSSLLISATDTIEFKDRLSGTHPITASHLFITNDVDANLLVSRDTITATNNISSTAGNITTVNGNFTSTGGSFTTTNGNFTSTNGRVDVPFITASIALSASQLLLPSFDGTSDLPAGSDITTNYLYNINGQLFFNGGAVGGSGGESVDTMAFQNHENVFVHGGNIYSDAPSGEGSPRYIRIGVSGSNTNGTYAGTTDRQSGLRIVEGSFIYLSASNAEITGSYGQFSILSSSNVAFTGGAIDGTSIGLATPAVGSFTELTGTSADINGGTLSNITIDGSWTAAGQTCTDLGTITTADINGGTIDGTNITVGTSKTLDVSAGTLTLANGQISANKVGAGTFDAGDYIFNDSSHVTASHAKVTNLDVTALTASDVDINGGTLSNVIVDETCTIQVDNADYNNLTASHMNIKDSLDFTLTGSQQSNISGSNLIVQGQSLTFNIGVFENEVTASSADINGGTIDGTNIGLTTPSIGSFSVLSSSDGVLSASHVKFGGATGGDIQLKGNSSANSFVDVQFVTGAYAKTKEVLEVNGILTASVSPLDASPGEVEFNFARNRLRNIATIETGSTGNSGDAYRYDSVTRDYLDTVITQKISVDTVTTTNVNLASLSGAVNGHSISNNDRILVTGQNTASQNGIYVKTGSGLVRAHDLPNGARASGATVFVTKGDFAGSAFICTSSKTSDVVNTNDLTFVSAGGATNAGNGLNKDSSNNSIFVDVVEGLNSLLEGTHEDRINLAFNSNNKLILSSSIQTDRAKFDLALSSSNVAFTGGAIDGTSIGGNTPSDGTFTNVTINNELSASSATLKFTKGEFDNLEVYNALETSTFTNERLVHISGTLQLARKTLAPSNKTDRIYNKDGSLYWQQTLLASESGAAEFNSLYVTGSASDGHGAFISGTLVVGEEELAGVDAFTFISGAIGSKDGSSRGVTVLGGDTVVSGNLHLGDTFYVDNVNDKVGIGLTSPATTLHIKDSSPILRIQRALNTQDSSLQFAGSGGVVGAMVHAQPNNDLIFKTFNGSNIDEILRLGSETDSDNVRQVIFLSNSLGSQFGATSMHPKNTTDINFFVSGSIGSRGGATKGTAVFGGDLHISGNLTVDGSSPGGGGGSTAADDITIGNAAVTITTTSGNTLINSANTGTTTISGSNVALTSENNITVQGNIVPSAVDTYTLGSSTAEWADAYFADGGRVYFGNDQDLYLQHVPDTGLDIVMNSPGSGEPRLTLDANNATANGASLVFETKAADGGDAGDRIGNILFTAYNSLTAIQQYAAIKGLMTDLGDLGETGKINFEVHASGSSTEALTIEGTSTAGIATVDLPDHNGSTGGLKLGGTLVTSTAAELNLLDVSSQSLTSGSSLRYNGSAFQWEEFSGGGGASSVAADDISTGDAAVNITTSTGDVTVKSGPGDSLFLTGSAIAKISSDTTTQVHGGNAIQIAAGGNNSIIIDSNGQITKLGGDTPATNEYLVWGGSNVKWSTWRGFKYNKVDSGTSSTAESGNHYSFDFASINNDYTLNLPAAVAANAGFEIRVLIKTNLSGKTLTIEPNGSETLLDIDSGGSVNNLAIDVSDTSSIGTSLLLVSDGVDQWEIL